jgi:hypothetical protein
MIFASIPPRASAIGVRLNFRFLLSQFLLFSTHPPRMLVPSIPRTLRRKRKTN